jgi:predicted nuclease of predicted toxin-antitoxin system
MRFLIDECLSTELVLEAEREGYEAYHLVRLGKAAMLDWNIVHYAVDGDLTLVTNNASDFRLLYGKQSLHPGLIIILPNVKRAMQNRLFREAIKELTTVGDLINRVLEVDLDDDEVTLSCYDLAASAC